MRVVAQLVGPRGTVFAETTLASGLDEAIKWDTRNVPFREIDYVETKIVLVPED